MGVRVERLPDGSIELKQPQLIDSILSDLGLLKEDGTELANVATKATPAMSTKLIGPDKSGQAFNVCVSSIRLLK